MRYIKLTLEQAVVLKERMLQSEDYREISRCRAMMLSRIHMAFIIKYGGKAQGKSSFLIR